MILSPAATSISITVSLFDDDGLALTGLVAATFPATYYQRTGAARVAISLSDLGSATASYSSGGVYELGGGDYRLDVPDAAFATATRVKISGEASGKHLIYAGGAILVANVDGNIVSIVTDAITAAALSAAGITKIQNGLSTLDAAGIRTALGLAAANLDTQFSGVLTAISNLNNLSALANIYGSPLLEIPDSSTTQFAFTVVIRDSEGNLVDLDGSPTLTAANAGGTDRSSNLSSVTHSATGRYTFTYGVTSAAAEESLRITVSGMVSAEGRYIEWVGAVVNYDTLTTLLAVKAKTDLIPASPASVGDIPTVLQIAAAVWNSATSGLTTVGSVGKRLVEFVTTLVYSAAPTSAANAAQVRTNLASELAAIGEIDEKIGEPATTLAGDIAALSLVSSVGGLTVSINVKDGDGENIQGATVRLVLNSDRPAGETDIDGNLVLGVSSGVWNVRASLTGYLLSTVNGEVSQDVTITADASIAIVMVATTIAPPADPEETTGFIYCVAGSGEPEEGVTIYVQLVDPSPSDEESPKAWSRSNLSGVSDSDGLCEIVLSQGRQYKAKREANGPWTEPFTTGSDGTFELPEILGKAGA